MSIPPLHRLEDAIPTKPRRRPLLLEQFLAYKSMSVLLTEFRGAADWFVALEPAQREVATRWLYMSDRSQLRVVLEAMQMLRQERVWPSEQLHIYSALVNKESLRHPVDIRLFDCKMHYQPPRGTRSTSEGNPCACLCAAQMMSAGLGELDIVLGEARKLSASCLPPETPHHFAWA